VVIINVHFSTQAARKRRGRMIMGKTRQLTTAWFESQETGWEADPDQAPEIRTVVQVQSSSQFWVDGRTLERWHTMADSVRTMADSVRASLGGSWFIP